MKRKCKIDGTYTKTETGECYECTRYKNAIRHGRIEGVDGRVEKLEAKKRAAKMKFEDIQGA